MTDKPTKARALEAATEAHDEALNLAWVTFCAERDRIEEEYPDE